MFSVNKGLFWKWFLWIICWNYGKGGVNVGINGVLFNVKKYCIFSFNISCFYFYECDLGFGVFVW